MKRAIFAIISSIVGLGFTLHYKTPPVAHLATSSTPATPTAMTLPPDSTDSSTGDFPTTDAAALPVPSTTLADAPSATTASTAIAAVTATTGPETSAQPSHSVVTTTTTSPESAVGIKATTTTAAPKTTTTTQAPPPAVATTTIPVKKTINGKAITTKDGTVQVAITVQGTKIVAVQALQVPTGSVSDLINSQAVPTLESETLKAQSANVATVSGATHTSDAWKQSLQAALSAI